MVINLEFKKIRSLEGQGFYHWARSSFVVAFFNIALPGAFPFWVGLLLFL